jgi:hypothetical protein
MKGLFFIFFLLFACSSFSQNRGVNFFYIDNKVHSIHSLFPDSLSHKLTYNYTTDLEKLRSIFRWITDNIAYKTKNYPFYRRSKWQPAVKEPEDSIYESKPLNERIAIDVLKQKEAVCDGYARLFKVLCDYAGLRSEIITGYARTNMQQMASNFRPNHRWNAVLVDSTWHLLDVTWASGFISYSDQFVKAYDDHYFLTLPEDFIKDHYPEDNRWTLLTDPPTLKEFYRTPFRHSAFSKYSVSSFAPAKGVIEAAIGDTINIELTMTDVENKRKIAPDTLRDAVNWLPEINVADLSEFKISSNKKKIIYRYPVTDDNKEWLNIIYNEDVILRYRLNMRKHKENFTKQEELSLIEGQPNVDLPN